jgi:hypothetical protein
MADTDSSSDPLVVLEKAQVEIDAARKALQGLYEQLAKTNDTAKEIARNALCRALVERLQLAEREAAELVDFGRPSAEVVIATGASVAGSATTQRSDRSFLVHEDGADRRLHYFAPHSAKHDVNRTRPVNQRVGSACRFSERCTTLD